MKAVMVMFDTLNRHMLSPYGCQWTHTPNFQRLADRSVKFENCYVGSMPCMPARRELHTGRLNFLHRSWGPLEPFDDSMPELLQRHGIHSHLSTDHYHYFEDGGMTYHNRYTTWDFERGQEGDPWKGQLADPEIPEVVVERRSTNSDPHLVKNMWRQDWVNRQFMPTEETQPQPRTFANGLDFIRRNQAADNWFLQIETFDPHEPFFSQRKWKDLYPHAYNGRHFDWPPYRGVEETPEEVQHMIYEYAALLSMCDAYMGEVLDAFDRYNLWDDTMLIVCTDHGFLLGEHDWWAKNTHPFYNEIAHTPLFIWDPRSRRQNATADGLTQMIDLPATLLDYFDVPLPADMQGIPLADAVAHNAPTREAILFGHHGGHVNCTDGRYVYMRAPASQENAPLYQYTLMPTHMRKFFEPELFADFEVAGPFRFTKGAKVMQLPGRAWAGGHPLTTLLYDLANDPNQEHPLDDAAAETRMIDLMVKLMAENDAPAEQYTRLGLA
ncbi:MAG: sulfatase [Caldilineaceae bacterium]|nr:sulfatase [Caldilineaceae bacterium]